jgi:hypothetical protein
MMSVLSFDTTPDVLRVKSTNKECFVDISVSPEGSESDPRANRTVTLLFDTHFLGFSAVGLSAAGSSAEIEVEYATHYPPDFEIII